MEKIYEFTLRAFKASFDISFTLNMIPLKRWNRGGLGMETAALSSVAKYTVWFMQSVFFFQKLIFLLFRSVTSETYAYFILHINIMLQIGTGVFCTAS